MRQSGEAAVGQVGQRDRQGIGSVGHRNVAQAQDGAHHLGHLGLGRSPASTHGAFDASRGVLGDGQPGAGADEQGDASRMAELGRGLCVLRKEDPLDADVRRSVFREHLHERDFDEHEPFGERPIEVRMNDPVRHVHELRPDPTHDAPPEVA